MNSARANNYRELAHALTVCETALREIAEIIAPLALHPTWQEALTWRGYDADMQARCTHCRIKLGHADSADDARTLFAHHVASLSPSERPAPEAAR